MWRTQRQINLSNTETNQCNCVKRSLDHVFSVTLFFIWLRHHRCFLFLCRMENRCDSHFLNWYNSHRRQQFNWFVFNWQRRFYVITKNLIEASNTHLPPSAADFSSTINIRKSVTKHVICVDANSSAWLCCYLLVVIWRLPQELLRATHTKQMCVVCIYWFFCSIIWSQRLLQNVSNVTPANSAAANQRAVHDTWNTSPEQTLNITQSLKASSAQQFQRKITQAIYTDRMKRK